MGTDLSRLTVSAQWWAGSETAAITSARRGWVWAVLIVGMAVQALDAIVRRRRARLMCSFERLPDDRSHARTTGWATASTHAPNLTANLGELPQPGKKARTPSRPVTGNRSVTTTVGTHIIRHVPLLARASPSRVGAVGLVASAMFPISKPMAATALVVALAHHRRTVRSADRARVDAVRDELSLTLDLLRVAVSAGLTVRQAIAAVCSSHSEQGGEELSGLLARAVGGVARGERYIDAIAALPDQPVIGPELRLLAATLVSTERFGTPPGPALAALAKDVRDLRRRLAEAEARRVPVRMLAPLVLLLLPSFALLTIAPLLAGGLGSLRLTP